MCLLLLSSSLLFGQSGDDLFNQDSQTYTYYRTYEKRLPAQPEQFILKSSYIYGYILPLSENLEKVAQNPAMGAELAVEMPSWNTYAWQQYLASPTLGAAFVWLNLGNNDILGNAFALYPYMSFKVAGNSHLQLNYKVGGGLSFFTKTWNRCDTLSGVYSDTGNSAIGSVVNVYLNTAMNLNVAIYDGFAASVDLGYSHMSNGSMLQPNGGLNILYASLGVSYDLDFRPKNSIHKSTKKFPSLPYLWSMNVVGAAGSRELYYGDNKSYLVGSLHLGATYNINNWYSLGGGVDAFYDGAFVQQGITSDMTAEEKVAQRQNTTYNRYLFTVDKFSNKVRVGISINNEFKVGRVTALLDWGVYVYDPVRCVYGLQADVENRSMFYLYDVDLEDGWNYFRLGLRCRVWDNLFVQASLKTHLQKAEMIEWGIGYKIPYAPKRLNHGKLY